MICLRGTNDDVFLFPIHVFTLFVSHKEVAMKLLNIRLLVADMNASLRFYRDTLGFEQLFADPDGEYTELSVGGAVTLALFGRTHMAEAVGTTHKPAFSACQDAFTLAFEVDDVDGTVARLEAKGVVMDTPAQDRPTWMMRTAHFRDPDGNLIEILTGLASNEQTPSGS